MTEELARVISLVIDAVGALVGVGTLVCVIVGLRSWRTQLRGGAKFEVARRVLAAVNRLRRSLRAARASILRLPSEDGHGLPADQFRSLEKVVGVLDDRWLEVTKALGGLDQEMVVAEAVLPKYSVGLEKAEADVWAICDEWYTSARLYCDLEKLKTGGPLAPEDEQTRRKLRGVVYAVQRPDEFWPKVLAAQQEFNKLLGRYVGR